MSFFNVNFNRPAKELLPVKLRQPVLLTFSQVSLSGIKSLYLLFQNARSRNLYDLSHRQQVVHVEAVLNDYFDIAFRRIRIVDAPIQYEPLYLSRDAEDKPKFLYTAAENKPTYLYTDYEIEFLGIDFIVQIPFTIPYDEAKLKALVEKYKTPGMAYIIESIT